MWDKLSKCSVAFAPKMCLQLFIALSRTSLSLHLKFLHALKHFYFGSHEINQVVDWFKLDRSLIEFDKF